MKNHILKRFVALLLSVLLMNIINISAQPAATVQNDDIKDITVPEGFEAALQNERYTLSFNSATANVALTDKNSGETVYATPIDAENDTIASGDNVGMIKSQVAVYYYQDQSLLSMNSFTDCIEQQGIEYKIKNDILSVTYNLGDTSFSADILPRVLSKERMEKKILSKLGEDEAKTILSRFKLYSRKELDKEALKSIKLNFPGIEKNDLYIRSNIPDYIAESIWELFEKAGYTEDDLQKDCDENGIENPYEEKVSFNLTLEYRLNEDGFSVSLDPDKIEYLEEYKPCRIEILPFFGATNASHSGYMFVPDGSGSIIDFNNGKLSVDGYWKRLFNDDGAVTKNENISDAQMSVLPVFALSSEDYSILATIDSGYEVAGIAADVSGKFNSYNYVYSFFDLVSVDNVSLSNQAADSFLLTSKKPVSTDIKVSYHITQGNRSYSELAVLYRDILKKQEVLSSKVNSDNTELNIDFITSATVTKRFLGIPYKTTSALTTYEQADEILGEIPDISAQVTLVNALSGGINQKSNKNLKLLSCLGSADERSKLEKNASRLSVSFYAQRAADIKNSDRTKALNRSNKNIYLYNIVSRYFQKSNFMGLLSPAKLTKYADSINKSMKSNKLSALNILDIGYELNSDFNVKKQYDRYEARIEVQKYLESISKNVCLSVDTGSYFSLKYVSKIKNIPTTHSGYKITDRAVPFYQIVVSGTVAYTTASLNQSSDIKMAFLKAVEIGAQLQCTWMYKNEKNIADQREKYYGCIYKDSIEQIAEYAREYSKAYKKFSGSAICAHIQHTETLTETVYENEVTVYVNYDGEAVEIGGITVNGYDFCVKEGGTVES